MGEFSGRNPRNYDGTRTTSKLLSDILPKYAKKFVQGENADPQLVLRAWPEVVGETLAGMTRAERFVEGILYVRVSNASLYSLLSGYEKKKVLHKLQEIVPGSQVRGLVFRIG